MDALLDRVCKQIEVAYNILSSNGQTYTFNASNGDGTRKDWDNCIGTGIVVIRRDSDGYLKMHYHNNVWLNINYCRGQIYALTGAADILLEKANIVID